MPEKSLRPFLPLLLLLALSSLALSCVEEDDGIAGPRGCTPLRDEFAEEVWTPLLGEVCVGCHQPGGAAWEAGANFVLLPEGYPGFRDQNLAEIRELAPWSYRETLDCATELKGLIAFDAARATFE